MRLSSWKRLAKRLMKPCSVVRVYLVVTASLLITFCIFSIVTPHAIAQTPVETSVAEQEPIPAGGSGSEDGYDASAVPTPNGAPSALQGESLYLENCAPCHGQNGDSDGPVVGDLPNPPPLFSDPETLQLKSPAEYFHTTKFGRIENLMPPWGNRLSDDDIWNVAAYAWTLHTSEEQIMTGLASLEQATADEPNLLGSVESTFADSSFLFRTQAEIQDELALIAPEMMSDLSATELANVTDYLRSLTVIPPWGAIYRAGEAGIGGAVLPATTEEPFTGALDGLPVTLTAYIQFEPVASFETMTDAGGTFHFDGLSELPSVLYLLETTYSGVSYRSDVIDLAQMGDAALSVELPVYETTEDDALLTYNRVNWVVDYAPGELIVGQILSIGNEGNQTVVGRAVDGVEQPVTVGLLLPAGATSVQFQDGILGDRYQQLGDTVYDTMPVIPGERTHQVFMSYRLLVENEAIQIAQAFRYPIQTLNLLVADIPGIEADAPELTFVGAESVQNIPYLYWQGQGLEPQTFSLALAGVLAEGEVDPRGESAAGGASGSSTESGTRAVARTTPVMEPVIPIAVGSILFFLLAGIVVWPLSRLRGSAYAERLQQDKARLTKEIALLDDRHEGGELDDDDWLDSRRQLKERLLSVTRQIQNSSG